MSILIPIAQRQHGEINEGPNAGGRPLENATLTGGSSGAVISPAPKLGLSAYQIAPVDPGDNGGQQ